MNNFERFELSNGIKIVFKRNENTPRSAINIFIDAGIKKEQKAGLASLSGRMLLQGTQTRTAEELAKEIDLYAIDLSADNKQDYTKVKAVFLNEDLGKSMELLEDIIKNSTFENFDKEARKFKGEIEVDLDSPKTKAVDNLVKNLYQGYPYGNSHTVILEEVDSITQEDVKNFYFNNLFSQNICISVVGDFEKDLIKEILEKSFGDIKSDTKKELDIEEKELEGTNKVTIAKEDASQAQVIQGWLVPGILSEENAALSVLNTILGSCGLSSRLFVELRDKKGLAYVVRSSYDPLKVKGNFSVYIATEPKNIGVSLEGFKTEIKKLQQELVPEKELESAKNNILGKREFFHETNAQQAHFLGFYEITGLGAEYDSMIKDKIKNVTAEQVRDVAAKYLNEDSVISLLAPGKFL